MHTQWLAGVFILGCAVALIGQGQPSVDLEGVWDFSTITPLERPSGLAAFRSPKRKARRDNVNYLGLTNREKKETLADWVRAGREAVEKSSAARG